MNGVLAGLFERRFHVSQTPPGWVEALSGWATATGIQVSPERALELTDVYACVRVLAESVAMLPLVLYRRLARGKERAPGHYLYPLLHDAPNPEMTALTFRETLMGHLGTWGNAYAEIEYNRAGGINALWPLRPDKMQPKREDGRGTRPGQLVYEYTLPLKFGSGKVQLPSERVFHVRGLAFDGLVGYSPIGLQRQAVGLGLAAEEYAARFFANDARPGGVLRHPGAMSDKAHDRLKDEWEKAHRGLSQAHRVAILEEGVDFKEVGFPPADAQFVETAKLSTVKVARMYRVPLHLIQEQEKQTSWGTGIEQMNIGFVVYTLLPWLRRWEQEIGLSLLTPREREELFAEHLVEGLLRGDVESRYNAYATARQWGWLSANDVRRLENMNPVEGGDTYLVPLNMIPAGSGELLDQSTERAHRALMERDARATTNGGAQVRHRLIVRHMGLYEDVAARVLRREANDVGNAADRFFKRRDQAAFSVWLREFYQEHIPFVRDQFAPLAASYGALVTDTVSEELGEQNQDLGPRMEGFIRSYLDSFAARHATVSESRIREIVQEAIEAGEDPAEVLRAELGEWPEKRAAETSRWETVRYANAVALMAMTILGVRRKVWVTFGDNCPYCNDLSGRTVGIDQEYLPIGLDFMPEGAERPLHVGRSTGHPPLHASCDCGVAAGY